MAFLQPDKEKLAVYYSNQLLNGEWNANYPLEAKRNSIKISFLRRVKTEDKDTTDKVTSAIGGFLSDIGKFVGDAVGVYAEVNEGVAYPFSEQELKDKASGIKASELINDAEEIANLAIQRFVDVAKKQGKTQQEIEGNLSAYDAAKLRDKIRQAYEKLKEELLKDPNKNVYGQTPTEEERAERARQNRLSEQAALILTADEILAKINKQAADGRTVSVRERMFKNFAPIRFLQNNGVDQTPTGHFAFTSAFTKKKSMTSFFRGLPPQIMSFLIPSIKIYKVFYPFASETADQAQLKGYDWRIPFDDVPVTYSDQTSQFVSSVEATEKILSGISGLHAVGIKSFNYEYKGTNPAEINTNIHATLVLYFQNPAELIKEITIDPNVNFKPALPQNQRPKDLKFIYSDLINQQPRRDPSNKEKFNSQYYRIKIECGYADINKNMLAELLTSVNRGNEVDALYDAIISTKVVLFLSPYKYDLSFQENGSVELKINFNAALDEILASDQSDIFQLTQEAKSLLKISDAFERYLSYRNLSNNPKDNTAYETCNSEEEIKKVITEFKAVASQYNIQVSESDTEEQIVDKLSEARKAAYNSLFKFLLGYEAFHQTEDDYVFEPNIYEAKYNSTFLGVSIPDDQRTESRLKAYAEGDNLLAVNKINDTTPPVLEPKSTEKEKEAGANATRALTETTLKEEENGGPYNIKFVLLGDIFDIALNCLNDMSPAEDIPRFVFGNIPFAVPSANEIKKMLLENKRIKSGFLTKYDEKNYNLGDIPISLNLFQEFMIEKVIKPRKTRYPVNQFLKDILSELVYPAIQPRILGQGAAVNASIRFSTAYFTFPTVAGGLDLYTSLRPADIRNYPPPLNEEMFNLINAYKANKLASSDLRKISEIYKIPKDKQMKNVNYVFVYSSSRFPKNLNGDEADDIQMGVFHFRMGTETGIIKKVNFELLQIIGQRELVARTEGKGYGNSLKQYYNATVDMFGNDIFRPGDYVYIHPNYTFNNRQNIDNQKVIDLTEKLGIGGYYLVLDVNTNISEGTYDTRLRCVYQATVNKKPDGTKTVEDKTAPCANNK